MMWLLGVACRPLILAAAAWIVLRIFRVQHPASQHLVWSGVLAGMLLLAPVTLMPALMVGAPAAPAAYVPRSVYCSSARAGHPVATA